MRIAIYHNLPSGGGKRALYEMTRRLAQWHHVDLFTLSCAEHTFCDVRPYVAQTFISPFTPWPMLRSPFGRLNQLIRIANMWRLDALDRRIAAQIDHGAYDVVFAHHCQFRQSPGLLRFLCTPGVYYLAEPPRWIYEPAPRAGTQPWWRTILNRLDPLPLLYRHVLASTDLKNTRAAGLVLTNSYFSREAVVRIYNTHCCVCYLGADTEMFQPLPVAKQHQVLSVGMLNPRKGFDFVISSLALLPESARPRLIIVANSEQPGERAYLQSLAAERGVDLQVRIMVSDHELVELYNQSIATLYAPILEPFGFVPIESMACGTPVIGVREGGVRETVVDGVTGALVDREPQAMADVLAAWLANPRQASRLGRQAQEYVRVHWTWDKTIETLEKHLARAAGRDKRPG